MTVEKRSPLLKRPTYVNGSGQVHLGGTATTTATAPPAGGAGALPATPAGYISVVINGNVQKIPYY